MVEMLTGFDGSRMSNVQMPTQALAAIGEVRFVGDHQQVAVGQRQRRMSATAEWRMQLR